MLVGFERPSNIAVPLFACCCPGLRSPEQLVIVATPSSLESLLSFLAPESWTTDLVDVHGKSHTVYPGVENSLDDGCFLVNTKIP